MAVRPYSTTRPNERTAALSKVGIVQPFFLLLQLINSVIRPVMHMTLAHHISHKI